MNSIRRLRLAIFAVSSLFAQRERQPDVRAVAMQARGKN
jgi:hypothetical protein